VFPKKKQTKMKEQLVDTLAGLKAPIQVFESLDEATKISPDKALEQLNNNLVYRQVLPTARDIICTMLEAKFGVERNSKAIGKTKGGKDILQWEADGKYVDRVMEAQNPPLKDLTSLQSEFETTCRNFKADGETSAAPLAVDLSGTVRKAGGGPKLANVYKLAALKSITLGTVDRVNSQMLSKLTPPQVFVPSNDTTSMFTAQIDINGEVKECTASAKDVEVYGQMIKSYQDWSTANLM
jgi:hypothetical protein